MERSNERSATATTSIEGDAHGGFFANILTPGSSLNPVFLLIVDGVLATLLLIFFALLIISGGSVHFVFLMVITGCLWASVRWFVNELRNVRAEEAEQKDGQDPNEKTTTHLKDE